MKRAFSRRRIALGSGLLLLIAWGASFGQTAPTRLREWPRLEAWLAGGAAEWESSECSTGKEVESVDAGKALFALYCSNCHGVTGKGDGPRSPMFDPAPRDLTHGRFKFRTTETGEPPTREDLFRTVSGGLRGTGMLPFADLPEEDRWALVSYVRSLSPIFAEHEMAGPLQLAQAPDDIDAARRVRRGRKAWSSLGCTSCHGESGRGDGPAAATLTDELGRPSRTPDFATRPFKRGNAPANLFAVLVTGLDGSPMPSYRDAAGDKKLWDVVAYMRTLESPAPGSVDARDLAEAQAYIRGQYAQAEHAVVGGCGCRAKKRRQAPQP